RGAGDDRRGADQSSRGATERRRRALDPSGGGRHRQRHLRCYRGAHSPRAVLAGSCEAGPVVTTEATATPRAPPLSLVGRIARRSEAQAGGDPETDARPSSHLHHPSPSALTSIARTV